MSAYATLAGVPVLDARVSFPRVGAWTADLRVDTVTLPAGLLLLTLGQDAFVGAVKRASVHRANSFVRMVGGSGGLATELPAKGYHSSPIQVPLQDIAKETGEKLSARSESTVTSVLLGHWARIAGTGGAALHQLLLDVPGAVWRFLPSGELWVGTESWPKMKRDVEAIEYDALKDRLHLFSQTPGIQPGTTFLGRRVSYVEHRVTEQRIGTDVWFEEAAA